MRSLSGQAWLLLLLVLLAGGCLLWWLVVRQRRAAAARNGQDAPAGQDGQVEPGVGAAMDTPVMGIPATGTGAGAGEEAGTEPEPVAKPASAEAETAVEADTGTATDVEVDAEAVPETPATEPVTEPTTAVAAASAETAPHSAMQGLDKLPPIFARVPGADQPAESPYGPGSVLPAADGSPPGEEFQIKGNADSMLYHTTDSPYYSRTKAAVWFRTEDDAKRAGFAPWNRRTRQQARTAARQAAAKRL